MWWVEHKSNSGNFVILDDVDYFVDLHDHFVKTDPELGLTSKEVEKAIEILNREAE